MKSSNFDGGAWGTAGPRALNGAMLEFCPKFFDGGDSEKELFMVANPFERKNAPSSVKKMPHMGFLLNKDF